MPYEIIEHTADVGLKAWAPNLAELFVSAAQGMTTIILSGEIGGDEEIPISLAADSLEMLFHDWLSEINYLFLVQGKVIREFAIEITGTKLVGICRGENYNPQRHLANTEIKAVTYHQIIVGKEKQQWFAQVFFDL